MNKAWNPDIMIPLMLKAGACAMDYFQKTHINLKSDQSLVTEADLAVEQLIRDALDHPEDGCFVIGEESCEEKSPGYVKSAFEQVAYVVDPIDGTVNYANGLEMWGVSVGCVEKGKCLNGAIYLPVLGQLFITEGDEVMEYKVHNNALVGEGKSLVRPQPKPEEKGIIGVTQRVAKGGQYLGRSTVHCVGVAVYAILNVLRGRYTAYVGKLKLWDVAGALPMCERLGIEVRLDSGAKVGNEISASTFNIGPDARVPFSSKGEMFFCHAEHFDTLAQSIQL